MPYLADAVLDAALAVIDTKADRIDICSQEPSNYTEATSTYTLGNKDFGGPGTAFASPRNGDVSGRKIVSFAVTDGSVTGTGTVTDWAVSHVGGTDLLAASDISATQSVTSGNTWSLQSFDIEIPDA